MGVLYNLKITDKVKGKFYRTIVEPTLLHCALWESMFGI